MRSSALRMSYWSECREFYRQFREQYRNTGSILPSSRPLARALVSEFRKRPGPAHILEVGPGTGAVTTEIVAQMKSGDRLDIVEINGRFVNLLRRRFEEEPAFQKCWPQTQLIHAPIQEVPGEGLYDYLVSGLPLNNFPLALVREIFATYRRLLKPAGVLSYFEYVAIRQLKALFVGRAQRRHLHVLGRFLERRIRAYEFRHDIVLFNVPPAVARHLRFTV
jgi:phosphatidylethanolamine/phosphatidyl-N-methylethanolamine N-methyltransferase